MKDKNEIKAIINKYLLKNKIKGSLSGDVLHMQSFGKDNTFFTILVISGCYVIGYLVMTNVFDSFHLGIGVLGLLALILGIIGLCCVKCFLVYDIIKNQVYTLYFIGNKELWKIKKFNLDTIKAIAVNTCYSSKRPDKLFKKRYELNKKPPLFTVLSCLTSNNKLVNICEESEKVEAYMVAVERCMMLSECLSIECVICNRDEYIRLGKSKDGKTILTKKSRSEDSKRLEKLLPYGCLIVAVIAILLFILCHQFI